MEKRILILSAAAAGVAVAWAAMRQSAAYPGAMPELSAPADIFGALVDSVGLLGVVRISAARTVTPETLKNANVRAMLAVIRRGEGTADNDGYRRHFGGDLFTSFADHPAAVKCFTLKSGGRLCSSAAGAYQFLTASWRETKQAMGLADFSPASQDLAAVGRIAARGALADVMAGRLSLALAKLSHEWASLPGSPYGQPVISAATAQSVFLTAGGTIEGVNVA